MRGRAPSLYIQSAKAGERTKLYSEKCTLVCPSAYYAPFNFAPRALFGNVSLGSKSGEIQPQMWASAVLVIVAQHFSENAICQDQVLAVTQARRLAAWHSGFIQRCNNRRVHSTLSGLYKSGVFTSLGLELIHSFLSGQGKNAMVCFLTITHPFRGKLREIGRVLN